MKRNHVFSARNLTMMAALIAMQIVLARYLSIQVHEGLRISFETIPLALAGLWLGPVSGVLVALVSDVLGTVIYGYGVWFPPIALGPMAFALICMVLAGVLMHRTEDRELDNKLFTYTLLALSGSMLMSATPQYMMVLMPLLILYLVASDGRTILCWGLISAGTVIAAAFNNNFMLIDSAYAFMGIGSADWILSMAEWFESDMLGEVSLMDIITFSGGIIYYIGMVLLLLLLFEDWINRYVPPIGKVLSKIRGWNIG